MDDFQNSRASIELTGPRLILVVKLAHLVESEELFRFPEPTYIAHCAGPSSAPNWPAIATVSLAQAEQSCQQRRRRDRCLSSRPSALPRVASSCAIRG
jgi:hypothetical protein